MFLAALSHLEAPQHRALLYDLHLQPGLDVMRYHYLSLLIDDLLSQVQERLTARADSTASKYHRSHLISFINYDIIDE